jgi:hypothetical protein
MNRLTCSLLGIAIGLLFGLPGLASAQSGVEKRWQQKTNVNVDAQPVKDFIQELCDKHKVDVEFDPSVEKDQYSVTPFSLTADGITFGSVIDLACESSELVYGTGNGKLLISTAGADDMNMYVVQYPLAPLGPIPEPALFASGIQSLNNGYWKELAGDGGEVKVTPQSLDILQNRRTHAELEKLFDVIASANSGRPRPPTQKEKAEQLLLRKLQSPRVLPAESISIKDCLDQLLKKGGIPYWIHAQDLADHGIQLDQLMVMGDGKKMSIGARLDAILADTPLGWRVKDEVVQITSREYLTPKMVPRVYDVRRLITPDRTPQTMASELIENAEFGPWAEAEGDGGHVMSLNQFLVVFQTDAIHAKLAAALK